MAGNAASDWLPPVEFYFRVDFQNMNGQMFKTSFAEVRASGGSSRWKKHLEIPMGNIKDQPLLVMTNSH